MKATSSLPDWQRKLLDIRLKDIEAHPDKVYPIEQLLSILDPEKEKYG